MKKTLSWMIIFQFLALSSVFAQLQTAPKFEKSRIQNFIFKSAKIQQIQSQKFITEDKDLLTGLDITYLDDGTWFFGTRVKFNFESDHLVSQTVESLVDTEWIVESKFSHTYNNGLLIQDLHEELNQFSGELEPYEKYSYAYIDGILTEMVYEDWVENEWVLGFKDVFILSNGTISEGVTYYWNNDQWDATVRYTFEESNDSLIYTSYLQSGIEEWKYFEREIYPNMTIDELYAIMFNLNSTLQIPAILVYNQLPDYTYQEWDGESWINSSQQYTTYYYSPNDLLDTKYTNTMYWDEGNPVPGSSLINYYNEKVSPDSTVLSMNISGSENPEWNVFMKELYTYGNKGLLDEIMVHISPQTDLVTYKYNFEWNGVSTGVENPEYPNTISLEPAYPNPFNPTTTIPYTVGQSGSVKIGVYDMLGRYVATLTNRIHSVGDYQVQFNANGLASGLYFIRMEASGFLKTQKITLAK